MLSKEQLQRDVQERNEEIEKLECRIRELEQALIISADNLQKVFLGLKLPHVYSFYYFFKNKAVYPFDLFIVKQVTLLNLIYF